MDLETLRDAQQAAAAVIQTADSLNAPELAPLKARVEALFTRQEVSLNLSGSGQKRKRRLECKTVQDRPVLRCGAKKGNAYAA